MALETFNWSPRVNPSQDVTMLTREAQFGDGYTQTSGDGINPRSQSWDLTFIGIESYIKAIKEFLDRHEGTRAFAWKPPLEDLGLFRCKQYKPSPMGGGNWSLTATFIQAFKP